MSEPLALSIIRVHDQAQRVIGTAFLVDDTRAITCAHVVQDALGLSTRVDISPQLTVKIDFPLLAQQKSCFARVVFLDYEKDIAGLEITSDPPVGAQPVRLVTPEGELWEHGFRAFGFPMPEGVWASGVLRGKNAEGWVQIEDTKSTGYSIQPGFSGAPVWDEQLQAVVGMIVAADKNQNIKAAFCIPCELLSRWDALQYRIKPSQQKGHLFLSYKRDIQPDERVMEYLVNGLSGRGYTVFTDMTIRMGENWLERIDGELAKSDYLVVLLSDASADSEMVQSEIYRAYEYRKKNGHPQVLPIRVAYEDILPYSISAFLNPLQYILWNNEDDHERVLKELIEAMQGNLPAKEPQETIRAIPEEKVSKPTPEFDARILDELQMPGGTVRLQDKFYIERDEDVRIKNEMKRLGATVTIRAARQSGKSSLLVRGIQQAKQVGANTLMLDMQRVDKDHLTSLDVFLRYFAEFVLFKLSQDADVIDRFWRRSLSPQEKLTSLFEDQILEKVERNVVIGMDEIDQLLATPFYNEFFGLLRSWHNLRATDERWEKLSTIMVISTEPYLLISDAHQSPFNVGLNLYLQDFNVNQIQDLNQRHGSPLKDKELDDLIQVFGGHPFLTRKALYLLVVEKMPWQTLKQTAADDQGPFGDHLRRYHWMVQQDQALKEALKSVIKSGKCSDDLLHRLLQAGLVKASGDVAKCRCDMYRQYFQDKL
jgi:AAA domain-containing protein/TIR domain-containing protein/trypsin-like peptidase